SRHPAFHSAIIASVQAPPETEPPGDISSTLMRCQRLSNRPLERGVVEPPADQDAVHRRSGGALPHPDVARYHRHCCPGIEPGEGGRLRYQVCAPLHGRPGAALPQRLQRKQCSPRRRGAGIALAAGQSPQLRDDALEHDDRQLRPVGSPMAELRLVEQDVGVDEQDAGPPAGTWSGGEGRLSSSHAATPLSEEYAYRDRVRCPSYRGARPPRVGRGARASGYAGGAPPARAPGSGAGAAATAEEVCRWSIALSVSMA